MQRITVDKDRRCFCRGGAPFFYLGDTVWMAFQKLSLLEWSEYLQRRRAQGFTVLQVSLLPITHDNSICEGDLFPFLEREDGAQDPLRYNPLYFDRAEQMVAMAADADLTCALHLLWANYLPGTWAAARSPATVLSPESVRPLIRYVCERFSPYAPIYSVTGDVSFESAQEITYCQQAMEELHAGDPGGIVTLHLQPHAQIPEELLHSPHLDFYTYQGGHGRREQYRHVRTAARFFALPPRPAVNSEPCYEGLGFDEYGRYSRQDVRRAAWQSLLSGAGAGIGYGAHGLWSVHRSGNDFTSRDSAALPVHWRTALVFPGAEDMAYAKDLFERFDLWNLRPVPGLVRYEGRRIEAICASLIDANRGLALYLPYAAEVTVEADLRDCRAFGFRLESRQPFQPELRQTGKTATLLLPECNEDLLYVFLRD